MLDQRRGRRSRLTALAAWTAASAPLVAACAAGCSGGSSDVGAPSNVSGDPNSSSSSPLEAGPSDASLAVPDRSGADLPDASVDAAVAAWTLTWSDEFDGPDGSAVDSTKW